MPKAFLMLIMSCLLALSSACSKKASSPSGGGGKDDEEDTDAGDAGSDDGSSCSADSDDKDDDADLLLQDATTYADVKDIFDDNCISCHGDGTAENDVKLHTFSEVKKNASDALAAIEDGTMPEGGELEESDIEAIRAFIDDGLEEGESEEDDADDSSSSGSDNCGSSSGGDDEGTDDSAIDTDNFEAILNPPELKACHDQDKIFWRNSTAEHAVGYCIDVDYPAAFECNRAGVLDAFSNDPVAVTFLDEKEAAGWTYDQCGAKDGKPAVVMLCIELAAGGCGTLDQSDPKNLVLKSAAISTLPQKLEEMPPL